MLNIIVNQII